MIYVIGKDLLYQIHGLFSSLFDEPIEFTIDRPFIFAIVDETTGATLFLGRVLDPSA